MFKVTVSTILNSLPVAGAEGSCVLLQGDQCWYLAVSHPYPHLDETHHTRLGLHHYPHISPNYW